MQQFDSNLLQPMVAIEQGGGGKGVSFPINLPAKK